jgi:asparagine N-glycosylation enzyme membrane subunit Stt3
MKIINSLKDKWWLFALLLIFLFSYSIRTTNIVPDRLLSFDPIFQYRFTYYFANWGHLPVWDELTYYVGRITDVSTFMYFMTSLIYWVIGPFLKLSLMTVCAYMSAFYGALIVIPAFFLGKELSNKYGGLMSAALIGTAPQILTRTFGSSYDTDQLVLFFLVLNLYLGFRVMRKRTIANFSIALIGIAAFMLTWLFFFYPLIILFISVIVAIVLEIFIENGKLHKFSTSRFKKSLLNSKSKFLILIFIFISIFVIGVLNDVNVITNLSVLIGFAQSAEKWIVNISIAELQPFNIFSLEGWVTSTGRFYTNDVILNNMIILFFLLSIVLGIIKSFKKDTEVTAFLITLLVIAIYTTFRGIRFTEFTSALFIILIGSGFGILTKETNDDIKKTLLVGFGVFIIFFAMNIGTEMGKQLGPDISPNWDDAWNFLKTQTPEFSVVGTWWDPGHMITGLAERRAYADGAHCQLGKDGEHACLYTINDRITDLGKIMVYSNETASLELVRKYQGDSPKVYWIASDDLIGKFQWLQYFGINCDARDEQQANQCPLYIQIPEQSRSADNNGNIILRKYGNIYVFQGLSIPMPFYVEGINGALFNEIIYYSNGEVNVLKMNETEQQSVIQVLKPLEKQLNFRFSNQTIGLTAWIPQHYGYIVLIPSNLRNSVFTKMFMLEGQGLEHFKQVFRNEQVKIYEVI